MGCLPPTTHRLGALICVSALQKCIRRGMEREAMEFACELMHTSKSYNSWVCNRLEIISHEDIDAMAQPHIVPFVRAACEQARAWYDPKKLGKSRMAIGNAIRLMCRAKKSREGDHFQAAIGLANQLENKVPEISDFVYDKHTLRGRRMGRGLEHFRSEATKLVPPPEAIDPYEDEAYRLLPRKATGTGRRPRATGQGSARKRGAK